MLKYFTLILAVFSFASCQPESNDEPQLKQWKSEVVQAEADFATMVKADGLEKAFLAFAAKDAVLQRNQTVLKGEAEFRAYFASQTNTDISLEWIPDFVHVARSGDLAYTYGRYTYSARDTCGELIEAKGIFHTVWQRQADGSWKYVWD